MEPQTPGEQAAFLRRTRGWWACVVILVAAVLAGYANCLRVPLLLDDQSAIADNGSIRQLWPLSPVLNPPPETLSSGRPLLNWSFALNYAAGGLKVTGYHVVNLCVHVAATLVLFSFLCRLFRLAVFTDRIRADATWIALGIALLWALNPVNTESVTYLSQRAESLMGLLYLTAFYGLLRGATQPAGKSWYVLAVAACALGVATKEVMITAPVLLLLFDWIFLSGSFDRLWSERRWVYAGFGATWVLLAWLMYSSHIGQRGIGLINGFTPWRYLCVEFQVLLGYLRLSFWPGNLVFDYGWTGWDTGIAAVLPSALAVVGVLIAGTVLCWRRKKVGWPVLAFFVLLAPTSTIVPVAWQPMAESRLYLPLIVATTLAVLAAFSILHRRCFLPLGITVLCVAALTIRRNSVYQSEQALWIDTVAKAPTNARAHNNLGALLARAGRSADAESEYYAALRLSPDYPEAHNNLGTLLAATPARAQEAFDHYVAALKAKPDFAEVHYNLANLLARVAGHEDDAIAEYQRALQYKPGHVKAHNNLALLLGRLPGRQDEAIAHYRAALSIDPEYADAHNNLGALLVGIPGRAQEALAEYEAALRSRPDSPQVHFNIANLLAAMGGRDAEAERHFEASLRAKPGYADAHANLAALLSRLPGRENEALANYEAAVRLQPGNAGALNNLAVFHARLPGHDAQAIQYFVAAIQADPASADAHYNLGTVLKRFPDRQNQAAAEFATALRLRPDFPLARNALDQMTAAGGNGIR